MGNVETTFNVKKGASTDATFGSIQKSLNTLVREVTALATAQAKLGATGAVQSLGQFAQALANSSSILKKNKTEIDSTKTHLDSLSEANSRFATKAKLVQEAWRLFSSAIGTGNTTVDSAIKSTLQYEKALANLEKNVIKVSVAGKVYAKTEEGQIRLKADIFAAQSKINENLTVSKIKQLELAGALKLTSNGFKIYTQAGAEALISDKKIATSVRQLQGVLSEFEKQKKLGINRSNEYKEALAKLASANSQNIDKFKAGVAVLKQTETGITHLTTQTKTLTSAQISSLNGLNRTQVMIAQLNGHLKASGGSFKVFTEQGLKVLGISSLETAKRLGILDVSFRSFESRMNQLKMITGMSDKAFMELQTRLLGTGKTFAELTRSVENYTRKQIEIGKSSATINKLAIEYEKLFASSSKLGVEGRKLFEEYRKGDVTLTRVSKSLKDLLAELNKNEKAAKSNESAIRVLGIQYKSLFNSTGETGKKARELIKTFDLEKGKINELRASLSQLNRSYADHTRSIEAAKNAKVGFHKVLEDGIRALKVYSRYTLVSSIVYGFTNTIRNATDAIINHNQALHDLTAITDGTVQDMILLNKVLLETAADSKYSINEIAHAMKRMGQAGFTSTEIMKGIGPIAELATGTLETLENTVDLVTTALRVFNLGMDQTARVTDVFANAVTKSKLTIQGVSTALNYIGPIGEQVGLTLEEASSAMAMLSDQGIKFSTIGTGLRRFLQVLLDPTKEFKEAITAAGMSLEDFNPEVVGFGKVLENLPKIVKNASDSFALFGMRGSTVVSTFVDKGVEGFNRYMDSINEVGAAHRMASEQIKGLRLTIDMIKQKFGVLAVEIAQKLVPVFLSLLKVIDSVMGLIVKMVGSPMGQFIVTTISATVAITSLMIAMRLLFSVTVVTKISAWTSGIANFTVALINLGSASKAATAITSVQAMSMMTLVGGIKAATIAALAFIATPLGAVLTGIAVAASFAIWEWTSLTNRIKEYIIEQNRLQGSFQSLSGQMKEYLKIIKDHGAGTQKAQDANKALLSSFDELAKSGKLPTEMIEDFKERLLSAGENVEELQAVLKKMSGELDSNYSTSLMNSAKAADGLYQSSQRLWKTLKFFFDWLSPIGLTLNIWDKFVEKFPAIKTGLKSTQDGTKSVIDWIYKQELSVKGANKAYEEMSQKAEKGNEKAKVAMQEMEKSGKAMAEGLLKGAEAADLTEEAINELALSHANAESLSLEHTGALIKGMENYAIAARKAEGEAAKIAAFNNSLTGVIKKTNEEMARMELGATDEEMSKYYGNRIRNEYDFRNKMVEAYQESNKKIDVAREKEKVATDLAYKKIFGDWKGTEEEKQVLSKAYAQRLLEIDKQANGQKLSNLKKARAVLIEQNDLILADYKEHLNIQLEAFNRHNQEELTALDQKHQIDLARLSDFGNKWLAINGQIRSASAEVSSDEIRDLQTKMNLDLSYYSAKLAKEEEIFKSSMNNLNELSLKHKAFAKSNILEEKDAAKEIKTLNRIAVQEQIKLLEERKKSYSSMISDLLGLEKELTNAIKAEQDRRKGLTESLADVERKVRYNRLSEEKIAAEELNRAYSLISKARNELSKGNISTGQEGMVKSQELVNKLLEDALAMEKESAKEKEKLTEELIKLRKEEEGSTEDKKERYKQEQEITREIQNQSKINSEAASKVRQLEAMYQGVIRTMQQASISTEKGLEGQKTQVEKRISDLQNLQASVDNSIVSLESKLLGMTDTYTAAIKPLFDAVIEQIEAIEAAPLDTPVDKYNEAMDEAEHKTKKVLTLLKEMVVQAARAEAAAEKAASAASKSKEGKRWGGKIPGYGGGDRRTILVEDGEFVVRKEAVKKYGDSLMSRINSMSLPKFNTGGKVKNVINQITERTNSITSLPNVFEGLSDFGRVVLDIGGSMSVPVLAHVDVVSELNKHLIKMKRFSS